MKQNEQLLQSRVEQSVQTQVTGIPGGEAPERGGLKNDLNK